MLIFCTGQLGVGAAVFAAPPPQGYPYGPQSDWLSRDRVVVAPETGFKSLALSPAPGELTDKPWKTLLILVDFPDVPRKGSPAYFKDMLFAHHGSDATGKEYAFTTMADLYARMSGGALTFGDTTVVGWFEAPEPYTYYTQYDGTSAFQGCHGLGYAMDGFNSGAQQLMALALARAEAAGVNLAEFNNVDPAATLVETDGVFVVHAGPGGEQTAGSKACVRGTEGGDLWSHEYYVAYESHIVHYLIGPGESASKATKSGLSAAGVWAHEFGHMLNLPDLYEPATGAYGFGVGCWDLMGYGIRSCWDSGYDGDEPGNDPQEMSVWTRAQLGWATPREVTDNACNRKIAPVVYGGETFKVTPDPAQPADYFLVEYRAAVGADRDLLPPATSDNRNRVCVWHIDDRRSGSDAVNEEPCYPNEDRAVCKTDHYNVSLVQPDGNYSVEKASAYAEAGDCLGPNAELTSGPPVDSMKRTNYDLWPWEGTPASHWTVRTGALAEQATVTILVNDEVQTVAPVIGGTPRNAARGKLWKFQPKLGEEAGLPVWSLLRYPKGMTIDAETGLISWRAPKSFSADKVVVEIRVENCGGADTHKVNLYLAEEDDGFFARCGIAGAGGRGVKAVDAAPYLALMGAWVALRLRRRRGIRIHQQ